MANKNQFRILTGHQKEPVQTWSRGQDISLPKWEKASLSRTVLLKVEVLILALGNIKVFKNIRESDKFYSRLLQESINVIWLSPILNHLKSNQIPLSQSSRPTKHYSLNSIILAVRYFRVPPKKRGKVQEDYVLNAAFNPKI